jgi:hypothetical protein
VRDRACGLLCRKNGHRRATAFYFVRSFGVLHEFRSRLLDTTSSGRALLWRKRLELHQCDLAAAHACRCRSECVVLRLVDELMSGMAPDVGIEQGVLIGFWQRLLPRQKSPHISMLRALPSVRSQAT